MTEQTPQDEAREGAKQKHEPRDAAFWAQRIERLEVSDVPEGAANVNVQGRREVGALQGFGQLWQKTYREISQYESASSYTQRRVLGRLCATLEANSPACPMSSVVGEPVFGILPPGKPLVADESFLVSEESLSPTASVCLAR